MHRQQVFNGNELITDLDAALAANDERRAGNPVGVFRGYPPDHLAYLHSCALGWQVERMKSVVPQDQLHIVLYDDFANDPELAYRQVIEFLDLAPEPPESFRRINVAKIRKYPALDRFARSVIEFRKRNNIKLRLGITSLMRKWNKTELPIPPLTDEQRQKLASAFQSDVALLEKSLGRSLSHWLEADRK